MPHEKIRQMSGMPEHHVSPSHIDFSPCKTAAGHDHRFAGMSEHEMREFMKEEQKEGVHPSLKGKRF